MSTVSAPRNNSIRIRATRAMRNVIRTEVAEYNSAHPSAKVTYFDGRFALKLLVLDQIDAIRKEPRLLQSAKSTDLTFLLTAIVFSRLPVDPDLKAKFQQIRGIQALRAMEGIRV